MLSLVELIEGCTKDNRYFSLIKYSKQEGYANPNPWRATSDINKDLFGQGDTPQEAVANLYLKLYNK